MSEEELRRLASRFGVSVELVIEILEASMKTITAEARKLAEAMTEERMARHVLKWHEPPPGTELWEMLHRN